MGGEEGGGGGGVLLNLCLNCIEKFHFKRYSLSHLTDQWQDWGKQGSTGGGGWAHLHFSQRIAHKVGGLVRCDWELHIGCLLRVEPD